MRTPVNKHRTQAPNLKNMENEDQGILKGSGTKSGQSGMIPPIENLGANVGGLDFPSSLIFLSNCNELHWIGFELDLDVGLAQLPGMSRLR